MNWTEAGLTGAQSARDIWQHKDLGRFENQLTLTVPKHGAVLLRVAKLSN